MRLRCSARTTAWWRAQTQPNRCRPPRCQRNHRGAMNTRRASTSGTDEEWRGEARGPAAAAALASFRQAADRMSVAQRALEDAAAARLAALEDLSAAGLRAADIAELTGLTPARVRHL